MSPKEHSNKKSFPYRALTLLQTEDTHQSRDKWSYILLVEELRRASTEAVIDAQELFRRMCFNALISNNDDHPRNHALLVRCLRHPSK